MLGTTPDKQIHDVARLGLVERSRLLAAGVTDDEISGRIERGSLRRVHPGVYATFGRALDRRARCLAACWAAGDGSVVSHRSALEEWGLKDESDIVEITSPRDHHALPPGVIVHRPNVLRPIDVLTKGHLPITNPMRTLLDAGAVLDRSVVAGCVELALTERLVTVKGLRVVLADLGGRGRAGTGALRRHLDRRALGDKRPESVIEPLLARLAYEMPSLAPVEYQPTFVLDGVTVRPDFRVPRALTVIEVDGLDAHASREALDRDLARQNLLVRHGYLVLRYTTTHLRRPARVAAEILEVCTRRIALLEGLAA